jgi:23S rRNA (pseudouridine1915-N3)-methyltransferase
MKITLILNGRTDEKFLMDALEHYKKKICHYIGLNIIEIASPKNTKSLSEAQIRDKEFELIEKQILPGDYIILLDEKGKELRSVEFAKFLQSKMNSSIRNLVFITGGPYGFSEKMYQLGADKLSLSQMTFSHQMVRIFFMEQLYRAFTILHKEPYHHE